MSTSGPKLEPRPDYSKSGFPIQQRQQPGDDADTSYLSRAPKTGQPRCATLEQIDALIKTGEPELRASLRVSTLLRYAYPGLAAASP